MTHSTEQSIPDTEGEWRISTYDESVILATCDARVIARCGSPAIAAQIVADHNSKALLVDALGEARGFACKQTWAKNTARAGLLVEQIDAALKAAGVNEK